VPHPRKGPAESLAFAEGKWISCLSPATYHLFRRGWRADGRSGRIDPLVVRVKSPESEWWEVNNTHPTAFIQMYPDNNIGYGCGYIILRKPSESFVENATGVFIDHTLQVNGICYGGCDRMPCFDIDEKYYNNALNPAIERLRTLKNEHHGINIDGLSLDLCQNFGIVNALFEYTESIAPGRNEIVALRSKHLIEAEAVNPLVFDQELSIEWLGIEVMEIMTSFSLLKEGIFSVPSAFSDYTQAINQNGLFDSTMDYAKYVEEYMANSDAERIEPLPFKNPEFYEIELGRIM